MDKSTAERQQQSKDKEIDLSLYLKIILRYWWLIGPISLGGAILAFIACFYLPPMYRAECRFEVFENKAIKLGEEIAEKDYNYRYSQLRRHIVILEESSLNDRIRRKILTAYPQLKDYRLSPLKLRVNPVRGAEQEMVEVNVDSFDEDAAMLYLNTLMDEYSRLRLEESEKEVNDTRKALINEEKRINEEIQILHDKIQEFKIKNNFFFLETKTEFDKKYVADLLAKANQASFEIDILSNLQIQAETYSKSNDSNESKYSMLLSQIMDAVISLNANVYSGFKKSSLELDIEEWKKRQVSMYALQAQYDIHLKTFKEKHPKMKELLDSIEIVKVEKRVYEKNVLNALSSRINTLKLQRKNFLDKASQIEGNFTNHAELLAQYDRMTQEFNNLLDLKNKVHGKVVAFSSSGGTDKYFMRMIREPNLLEEPVFPNKPLMTAAGFLVAFGLSTLIVLLNFVSKARNYNFSKIVTEKGLKCLSTVPHFPANKLKKNPLFLNELSKGSVLAEAYRTLKLNIDKNMNGNVVVLTSCAPNEGKTTSSLNLALCYSWSGKRCLIVDGDLRRSSLRRFFPNSPKEGLLDFLKSEQSDITSFVVKEVAPNLDYLPAGTAEELAAELLQTDKMNSALKTLKEKYDHIIIDSAPVVHVVDSIHFSQLADGVAVIIRSGKTKPKEVSKIIDRIDDDKLLGFVVNDFKASAVKFTIFNEENTGIQEYGGAYGYSYQNYKKKY
ncbi:MAG: polysaccharide biosynthesis tyrosine autokinase [Lentisphaeraceae bacterium]|nr:polysaccharide biosynthesis tyrosine autokinase [Lentisphaeraceae bacterium]